MSIPGFENMLEQLLTLEKADFTESTISQTKRIIADCLFVTWNGVFIKEVAAYCDSVTKEHKDVTHCIPVIGTSRFTTMEHSLLIHGIAIVSDELDEGNRWAKGHPSSHVFANALAAAYDRPISGFDFIRAVAVGYEIASRLAYASNMNDFMHPHGTWGTIGGAVAAGMILGKSKAELIASAYLAASLPLATSWEAAVTGMNVRNMYTGLGNLIGHYASMLSAYGFESSPHVVEHLWGNVLSHKLDASRFTESLWNPPLLEKNYFKYHASCRFTHASLDALQCLLSERKVSYTEVESIEVETYHLAARLHSRHPANRLAAKFSIPYVAAAMIHGKSLFESYEESVLFDPLIQDTANRVTVKENERLSSLLPDKRAAIVTIYFKGGDNCSEYVENAIGEYDTPMPDEMMVDKYKSMLKGKLSERRIQTIHKDTFRMDNMERFSEWCDVVFSEGGE